MSYNCTQFSNEFTFQLDVKWRWRWRWWCSVLVRWFGGVGVGGDDFVVCDLKKPQECLWSGDCTRSLISKEYLKIRVTWHKPLVTLAFHAQDFHLTHSHSVHSVLNPVVFSKRPNTSQYHKASRFLVSSNCLIKCFITLSTTTLSVDI